MNKLLNNANIIFVYKNPMVKIRFKNKEEIQ